MSLHFKCTRYLVALAPAGAITVTFATATGTIDTALIIEAVGGEGDTRRLSS